MTTKTLYIFLLSFLVIGLKPKDSLLVVSSKTTLRDTIVQSEFVDVEEKTANFSFVQGKDKITIKTASRHKKNSLIYYTDTIENQITKFSANNLIYSIIVLRNNKKWFSVEFEKDKNFNEFYQKDYEYLIKSEAPEFRLFIEKQNLFVFDISAGYGDNYLLIDDKGNVKNIAKGKLKKQKGCFVASDFEIFNIKTNKKINFKQFYDSKFRGGSDGLESYFELISDSTLMLTYFYQSFYEIDINNNLLILNSDFKIIKRSTIRKCPDANLQYKIFGNFLALFNAKFERVKLYSAKENKFYSLEPMCKKIYTESGNVLDENKIKNQQSKAEANKIRKQFENTVNFVTHCPKNTSFIYQIDTLNKNIVSCQIDEFRK